MKKTLLLTLASFILTMISLPAAGPLLNVPIKTIEGNETSLKAFEGKVLLIVNVASKCGFTKQYAALESVYQKYKEQGLVILGFPCNQFGGQEPGSNEEIALFCTSKFGVTFPMFEKLEVNGANRHPLYVLLAGESSPVAGNIKWNFTKFLISRDGKILQRFESKITPDAPALTQAIEAALAQKSAPQ